MLKSVKVRDYMAANLVTLSPDMEILRAIHSLVENRISGAPVVDERGNLVGVLSEQDCMRVALNAGYHEECAELIYRDLMFKCEPDVLVVGMNFNRRGGLDINPFRSNQPISPDQMTYRFVRQ